jgi:hypothetical protein
MAGNMMVDGEYGGIWRSWPLLLLDLSSHDSGYEMCHLLRCNAV